MPRVGIEDYPTASGFKPVMELENQERRNDVENGTSTRICCTRQRRTRERGSGSDESVIAARCPASHTGDVTRCQ
jgi:hypothetical protein